MNPGMTSGMNPSMNGGMRFRCGAGWLAGFVVAALLLTACAGPHSTLGSGSTACFRTIPVALDTVGHQGRYLGVRQIGASKLARRHPEFAPLGDQTICLAAFQGTFGPGSVKGAPADASGEYALVAVNSRTAGVVAAFVLHRLPLRFGHPV